MVPRTFEPVPVWGWAFSIGGERTLRRRLYCTVLYCKASEFMAEGVLLARGREGPGVVDPHVKPIIARLECCGQSPRRGMVGKIGQQIAHVGVAGRGHLGVKLATWLSSLAQRKVLCRNGACWSNLCLKLPQCVSHEIVHG